MMCLQKKPGTAIFPAFTFVFIKAEVREMYKTVKEIAAYIKMPVPQVERFIAEKKIRAHFDGEQYIIDDSQFEDYFLQLEKYREMIEAYWCTPIPEDIDVKDED